MIDAGMPRANDETPDAREALLRARAEVMQTMQRHGLAGVCVLAHGGSIELITGLEAPWCQLDFVTNASGEPVGMRMHAKLADFGGDEDAMQRSVGASLGFASALAEVLAGCAVTWLEASRKLDAALGAEHTPLQPVRHQ